MNKIYETPSADLNPSGQRTLSAAEKLDKSRRDMEEAAAIQKLNFVWGCRLVLSLALCVFFLFAMYWAFMKEEHLGVLGISVLVLILGVEILAIVAYFRRRSWCVVPLHIFAAISLFNLPFGTILSIVHFFNFSKIRFEDL